MSAAQASSGARDAAFRLLRAGFRLLPLSEPRRDALRQWFLQRFPGIRPASKPLIIGSAPSHRRALQAAGSRALGYRPDSAPALPATLPARLVAFYLPQYHPLPENDAAWGTGYTEWRAVSRALPQFEGHVQPRLPGALGFYDLRLADVLRQQAALAKRYGISAFCSYFYWFHGRTVLETPLRHWLHNPDIDFPLCLCWANEPWTRTWDGSAENVLIAQAHDAEDDLAFIAHVADYLRDARYLRVDGKPILLVYRPGKLPDARATAERWRRWCRDNGIGEIYLAYTQSFERPDPRDISFDAAVEFPPNLAPATDLTTAHHALNPAYQGTLLDWRDLPAHYLGKAASPYPLHRAVNCGWDNEPRRPGRGRTWLHAAPRRYRDWLRAAITLSTNNSPEPPLLFINAWNEWSEGAVLEPDSRLGHAWLAATAEALHPPPPKPARPCVLIHAYYPEVLEEMLHAVQQSGQQPRLVINTVPEKSEAIGRILAGLGMQAEVHATENRGRDILPFLRLANQLLDEGEDVLLKLHTKRSTHRGDGDAWRRELTDTLLGENSAAILAAFEADPKLGLVAPAHHLQPMHYYWGANATNVDYLCRRLGLASADTKNELFAAGSMYWLRLEALRPLLDAHLEEWEFEVEAGQVDGTLAHAIERIVLKSVHAAGYSHRAWPEDSQHNPPYRYARRD
ncbi:hypothetical protein CO609_03730 [Lysobacteraceae bacterium NML91-0268]|nr:hypothetical protein CO609_03730 [Xanthomonadaceae bacterium NML91-0268]